MLTIWTVLTLIVGMVLGSFITFYMQFKKRINDK